MASRLNPYLSFKDNARQALEFYAEVFGGELKISTFGEFGSPDDPGANGVMHGQLESPSGYTIMASDTPAHMEYSPGSSISISLSGEEGDELRGYWEKLAADGTVTVPLEKQMWGDEFGMVIDKFGIAWMVNVVAPQA